MEKITLKREMETLLITLYSKAMMSKSGQIIHDEKAEQIITQIDYDFKKLSVNKKTQVFMALRSAIIDDFANEYIKSHANALIISLGCGLDFRHERINTKDTLWYDLDYPQVIELKKQCCEQSNDYRFISSSVNDLNWLEEVDFIGQPVLIIAEGLTMYLSEEEIEKLFRALNAKFKDVTYIFDVYSLLSVKLSQKKLNSLLTRTGAQIKWGIDDPYKLEPLGITYLKSLYLSDKRFLSTMSSRYFKMMFALTMNIKTVNNAMRILVFEKANK